MDIGNFIKRLLNKDVSESLKKPIITQMDRNEYRARQNHINSLYVKYSNEYNERLLGIIKTENEKVTQYNNTCPKCGSHNVVNRAIETKDTLVIFNHCSDCTNEWESKELKKEHVDGSNLGVMVCHALDVIVMRLFSSKFDPYDVSCPYDSEEEAERDMIKSVKDEFAEILMMPLEVIYLIAARWANRYMFLTDDVFGEDVEDEDIDLYVGQFSDKLDDILVNKLGVRRLYERKN